MCIDGEDVLLEGVSKGQAGDHTASDRYWK